MRTLRTDRLGLLAVALSCAAALAAPILAPYDHSRQFDPGAGRYLRPGSRRFLIELEDSREILADEVLWGDQSVSLRRRGLALQIPVEQVRSTPESTSRYLFLLGTDRLGRDCWSRLLFAGRASLLVAILATVAGGAIGVTLGATAGFVGGILDAILMRAVDFLLSFPQLLVLLLCSSLFTPGPAAIVLILAAMTWMPIARIVRAEVRAAREQEFITSAIAVGCTPGSILCRHLLPHTLGPVTVAMTLGFGDIILLESALSFLGLGISPQVPTWGGMIADGTIDVGAWWVVTFPGVALVATVLGLNLGSDALLHPSPSRAIWSHQNRRKRRS
jgi:peptide/nickel transport system permease protein